MTFLAQLGIGGAVVVAVIWSLAKLIPILAPLFKSESRDACGTRCQFGEPSASKLHIYEVTEKVGEILLPELKKQTEVLTHMAQDIRGLRNGRS